MSKNIIELVSSGALIFDCDGTVAPFVESAHGECMAGVMKDLSEKAEIDFSRSFYDLVWQQELGKGILNFVTQYTQSLDESSAKAFIGQIGDLSKAEEMYEDAYIEFSRDPANGHFYDMRNGLRHLFEAATHSKIPVAILSNANQRVLEATLTASCGRAGMEGNLDELFTVVMGKDTIEGKGYAAKPSMQAVICIKQAIEEKIGRPVSLGNSIGVGDTPTDYKAFSSAQVGRIVACNNDFAAAAAIDGPDRTGFLTIGRNHSVIDAVRLFASHEDAHHHSPKLSKE